MTRLYEVTLENKAEEALAYFKGQYIQNGVLVSGSVSLSRNLRLYYATYSEHWDALIQQKY